MRTLSTGTNKIIINNCKLTTGDSVTVKIINRWRVCVAEIEEALIATASGCKHLIEIQHVFKCGVYTIEVLSASQEVLYVSEYELRCEECV